MQPFSHASIAFGYFYCIFTGYFTRGLFDYLSPETKNFKKIGPAKTALFQPSYSRQTRTRVASELTRVDKLLDLVV